MAWRAFYLSDLRASYVPDLRASFDRENNLFIFIISSLAKDGIQFQSSIPVMRVAKSWYYSKRMKERSRNV